MLTRFGRRATLSAVLGVLALAGAGAALKPRMQADTLVRFKIEVHTGNVDKAGTDADIFLVFTVRNGPVSNGVCVKLPDLKGNENEKNSTANYEIPSPRPDITTDSLVGLTLVNGMNGNDPGWFVDTVSIKGYTAANIEYCVVDAGSPGQDRWLDTKEKAGPAAPLTMRSPIVHTKNCGGE